MAKKVINIICAVISIAYAVTAILLVIDVFTETQTLYNWYMSDKVIDVRIYFGLPMIYFLIYNVVIWNKHDKKPSKLILLIILNVFYMPFYYFKSVKNGWE